MFLLQFGSTLLNPLLQVLGQIAGFLEQPGVLQSSSRLVADRAG